MKMSHDIWAYLPGFEQALWQGFDHKNVPLVPGFAKRNVNIPAIPRPRRGHGYKWLVHNQKIWSFLDLILYICQKGHDLSHE